MELRTGIHLSADVLQAFSLGKLDDTTADVVVNHLETCSACRQKAAAMSSDDFLNRLRDAHSRSGTPAPAKPLSGVPQTAPSSPSPSSTKLPLTSLPPELAGHPAYEIVRELGRGGMGVVYLAKNRLLGRQEVLKVVNKSLLERPGVAERFLREIQSAALLNHPNVVTAYNALEMGGSLAFAMEYVEGQDLAKVVKERGPLPVAYPCHYAREAALGLQHAFEKHMVHRDIKPQNLILAREGHKHIVKVLDFGLAKVLREKKQEHELTGSGAMLGTPDYIAPEQTLDAASADIRADIYSLGCTLYFLLTGQPPFKGNSLFEILHAHHSLEAKALNLLRSEVSPELDAVVRKMMAKQPEQRYQTPIEVAQALAPFIKQTTTGVPAGASLFQQPTVFDREGQKSKLQAAELVPAKRETEGGFGSTSAEVQKVLKTQRVQALTAKPARKMKWLIVAAAGVALLTFLVCIGFVGLWAGGVFKVKTKDGTIVLENLPPDAEVLVDDGTVTVQYADGKTAEIRVDPGKKHRLEVKRDGVKLFGDDVEVDADGRKAILVRLEPNARPLPPDQPQPPKKPTREYDELARGRWIAVLPSEEEFNRLRTEKAYRGAEPKYVSGILDCNDSGMGFPPLRAKDVIVRTKVKKLDHTSKGGVNVGLFLRYGNGNSVSAWCNGDGWFGIGRSRKGRPYEDLKACKLPDWYDGYFFEFAFAAVGDKLIVYVNGRKILEARDDESTQDRGAIAVNASQCRVLFRDIEVQILDK